MHSGLDAVRIRWADADPGDRRGTSRLLLGDLLPGAVVRAGPCARCGGAHGRPHVEGGLDEVSVAYAAGRAFVAAVSRSVATAVGIDAEAGAPDAPARIDRMRPETTLREWTRIEAALKADGRGLTLDPALVRIRTAADGWTAFVPGRSAPIVGRDLDGPAGVVLSVAIVPAEAAAARRATG
ncbi:4-phosphopantetheinyl transferase [Microbacterium sp. cx-59]|uniref:4-phosphopantetheinyl transferase n=1 Tax=Microbacterium sp. cx-59 TaxID=2891207 RepID=UPI001E4B8063|nr:4-phosphopantetheinyl transferase [Microbacterium sp. cx-59]MCC4908868.1 4-phosphopantetheinyl transferase [Microbacterium sp. cx-59]